LRATLEISALSTAAMFGIDVPNLRLGARMIGRSTSGPRR
jgi:hypothetical protein